MLLIVVGKDARYLITSHPYCILFCNTVQYISRDMTEVVYVNSFNKVSVFGFEPQVDMFINRPRGPRDLHLQHIGTCVKMEHHKYWDSPLIHLTFVSTLRWAAAYARMHSLVCRRWKERISMPGCRSLVRRHYSRRSSISSPLVYWTTTWTWPYPLLLFSLQQDTYAQ